MLKYIRLQSSGPRPVQTARIRTLTGLHAQKVTESQAERAGKHLNCKEDVITNPNVSAFKPFPVRVTVTSYLEFFLFAIQILPHAWYSTFSILWLEWSYFFVGALKRQSERGRHSAVKHTPSGHGVHMHWWIHTLKIKRASYIGAACGDCSNIKWPIGCQLPLILHVLYCWYRHVRTEVKGLYIWNNI